MILFYIVVIFSVLIIVSVFIFIFSHKTTKFNSSGIKMVYDPEDLNQDSFQKYAKFYGNIVPTDDSYDVKLNTIYDLITKEQIFDIREIANKSNCTELECILKIKYLKNKRMLGDYFIDTTNHLLVPCSQSDQLLLDRYKPYIYHSHLQVDEIAAQISNPNQLSIIDLRNQVFHELNYLDNKSLLNGVLIDDVDRTITYYTIEKKKEVKGLVTSHCPNCGALNDVQIGGKARCTYCGTIIVGKEE
ncbi:MAG: hypothetical protein IKH54_06625 [Bacilli bacterium]|nr:hypothetical protein [Bacilli bacterium]